jgi:hypothetical protein
MSKMHPGFDAVGKKISEKEGVPLKDAYAMLASSTRKASMKAKHANPALKNVKGK